MPASKLIDEDRPIEDQLVEPIAGSEADGSHEQDADAGSDGNESSVETGEQEASKQTEDISEESTDEQEQATEQREQRPATQAAAPAATETKFDYQGELGRLKSASDGRYTVEIAEIDSQIQELLRQERELEAGLLVEQVQTDEETGEKTKVKVERPPSLKEQRRLFQILQAQQQLSGNRQALQARQSGEYRHGAMGLWARNVAAAEDKRFGPYVNQLTELAREGNLPRNPDGSLLADEMLAMCRARHQRQNPKQVVEQKPTDTASNSRALGQIASGSAGGNAGGKNDKSPKYRQNLTREDSRVLNMFDRAIKEETA